MRRAGDEFLQRAHHLAAVADTQRERVAAAEEGLELVARPGVEQNRLGPPLPAAEDIAVREAPARREAGERGQACAPGDDVAHVHVGRFEPRPMERRGHFDLPVHALLPEDRDPGSCAPGDVRGRNVFGRIKCERDGQPRIGSVEHAVIFFQGAVGVVAQGLHPPGGLRPGALQVDALFRKDVLGVAREADLVLAVEEADQAGTGMHALGPQDVHRLLPVAGADLQDGAEFLGKQRGQGAVPHPPGKLLLAVAPEPVHVLRPGVGREHIQADRDAAMPGEGHLADRGKQSAVGAIVIRQHEALLRHLLHGAEKPRQARRVVEVRRFSAELAVDLREDAAPEAVPPAAQVEHQEFGFPCVRTQSWRERAPCIAYRREGRHHEGERRYDFLAFPVFAPGRAHRQRILAHRDGHADRRAQVERNRLHCIEQGCVLPGVPGGGHPVGRELDPVERIDPRGREVGQRLAHRHAPRHRTVDQCQRRALADRIGLAGIALEVEQGHGAISDRHLPGADERVAGTQPAHRAIADGHEERFVRH